MIQAESAHAANTLLMPPSLTQRQSDHLCRPYLRRGPVKSLQDVRTEFLDRGVAEQRQDPVGFGLEDLQRPPHAALAGCGGAVKRRAASEHQVGAERERLDD